MIKQQPQVGFTLLDSSESSSVMRFNVRHGVSVAIAMAAATDLRGRIAPLTGTRFTRQSIVFPSIEPTPSPPLAGSDITIVGVFIFNCGLMQYAVIELPGIKDEFISTDNPAGGLWIALEHPTIETFVEHMTSGIYVNRFGHVIESLEAAFVQIRP